ncbi:MAG: sulfur oxidation c-type cytochrome SoxX [Advenella sp.]
MKKLHYAAMIACMSLTGTSSFAQPLTGASDQDVMTVLKDSFAPVGEVTLDRLEQSQEQKACSDVAATGQPIPKEAMEKLLKQAMASVKPPADKQFLGDWKVGEKIAQSGVGLQFSDKPGVASGGNCYACHQMTKSEIAFGNIGPSLLHYGKNRGNSAQMLEYTWNKIYNSHAYTACSNMPRFGSAGILTEQQIKDVMALLFDPASPVNNE